MSSPAATAAAEPVEQPPPPLPPDTPSLFGRPRWFVTLFGTDMWERFSFYGMLAILFLFANAPKEDGGLGLSTADAGMLFGVYMATVFLSAIPGGWLGDRILGSYRATLYGAVTIGCGHLTMTLPSVPTVYLGLLLIGLGSGLLKPNLAGLLSSCYPREDAARRDAGFAVFYTSIQLSSLLAPLVVGAVGEGANWHLGFGAAALGMAFGVLQYVRGADSFGEVGRVPERPATGTERRRVARVSGAALAVVAVLITADVLAGTFTIRHVLGLIALLSLSAPVICFRRLLRNPEVAEPDRVRIRGYVWLFLAAALFWGLQVQGGSLLSLFARDFTDRRAFGVVVPASWFQSATPLFVLLLAPLFAWLWLRSGERISATAKFALGMVLMSLGLLVMAVAAATAHGEAKASPFWLLLAYLLMGAGEAAFAPVGMSVTTAVAPQAFLSQMVGVFWLSAALGAGVGSNALKAVGGDASHPGLFLALGTPALLAGLALVAAARPLTRRLGL
ncbi:oligopeptide:H+ symporter [Kitasatospora sp. NPDC097643]|uniref:peptide MFS transporter n=1 Tax=Kitasatospora sp. NPDC097643 TaxID=3157230 RepID=UPI0033191B0A